MSQVRAQCCGKWRLIGFITQCFTFQWSVTDQGFVLMLYILWRVSGTALRWETLTSFSLTATLTGEKARISALCDVMHLTAETARTYCCHVTSLWPARAHASVFVLNVDARLHGVSSFNMLPNITYTQTIFKYVLSSHRRHLITSSVTTLLSNARCKFWLVRSCAVVFYNCRFIFY